MLRSSCPDRRTGTLQGGPRARGAQPFAVAAGQLIAQFSTHILMSEQAVPLPSKATTNEPIKPSFMRGAKFCFCSLTTLKLYAMFKVKKQGSLMGKSCLFHKHIPSDSIHLAPWSKNVAAVRRTEHSAPSFSHSTSKNKL